MSRALMLVEDRTTADNIRAYVDPVQMWVGEIGGDFPAKKYEAIFVRYPSPNWFERRRVSPLEFSTFIRQQVAGFLTPGSTFQYI